MPDVPAISPRVYWLTEAFYPPVVGGQELFVARLAQALVGKGLTVSVITRLPDAGTPEREQIGAVRVRRLRPAGVLKGKGWKAFIPLASYLLRLLRTLIVEHRQYDVIIVSGAKVMPLIVVPLCLIAGKRCVLRVESYFELQEPISAESLRDMQAGPGRLLAGVLDHLRMFWLRRASCIIAISSQIEDALHTRGIEPARIRRIPNAVDLTCFHSIQTPARQQLRRRLDLPVDRTLLIFSGRLSRAKGLPMLMEAWPGLLARHPDLCLLIVGSGRLSFDDCEQAVVDFVHDHGLEDSVRFPGESDRVHEYLQSSDLFIFPTEYEGFSLALVEAMGCELTVVVTAVGAAPDLIRDGENGFLFEPKDSNAMIAALERALENKLRWNAIGALARQSVMRFDLDAVADQYRALCAPTLTPSAPGAES